MPEAVGAPRHCARTRARIGAFDNGRSPGSSPPAAPGPMRQAMRLALVTAAALAATGGSGNCLFLLVTRAGAGVAGAVVFISGG
ncbi:hypothetical protein K8O92_25885 [Nocardia asteroides]|nr:hypothetical protein K8O92_25885 [Nocardia asteroides]